MSHHDSVAAAGVRTLNYGLEARQVRAYAGNRTLVTLGVSAALAISLALYAVWNRPAIDTGLNQPSRGTAHLNQLVGERRGAECFPPWGGATS